MGLLQKALETYESHVAYASETRDGQTMMAPIGHIITRAELEITLDQDGKFVNATTVDKTEPKIIIPATEQSAGRTSAPCAHPLCEQIGYLVAHNEKKYQLYLEQLSQWANSAYSHPKLHPILHYVEGGTILHDLVRCGLTKCSAKGEPENDKMMIRWRVLGEDQEACWLDQSLFNAFTKYYLSTQTGNKDFCMVTGCMGTTASQHPKGIVSINGNAKLISANDSSGFTYRGRFTEESQALTVGYESSQKAHNALRWLVDNQSVRVIFGGRTFLCWNPQGKKVVRPHLPFMTPPKPIFKPSDYRDELQKVLNSKKSELNLSDGVVLAAFDAATTGRLSVTYYNEMMGQDFLQRLHDWDIVCCWPHRYFGISSPSLYQIVQYAFGIQRTEKGQTKMETDDRVLHQQIQRMLSCRVDKTAIGADVVKGLVNRASNLTLYKTRASDKEQQEDIRENLLFTACAVIRKYRKDRFKEEWNMALEPECMDRSYQFGRLLAVMEKVERDTYSDGESREPNAIRLQSVFCQRPMDTAANLEKQLERAYFPRLKPYVRVKYKNLIGEIMNMISTFPGEENKALDSTYLMGYYLQRAALYTKKSDNVTEENEND